jgi:hypothetical protein
LESESWEYLYERELRQQVQGLEAAVIKGQPADYAQYLYIVGQIRGIHSSMQALKDLRAKRDPDGDLE